MESKYRDGPTGHKKYFFYYSCVIIIIKYNVYIIYNIIDILSSMISN